MVTNTLKKVILSFVLFWKAFNSEWYRRAYFLNNVSLLSHMKNLKRYQYLYFYKPATTKLDRVMTQDKRLPLIKSQAPFSMWSGDVTWQIENIYIHFHKTY